MTPDKQLKNIRKDNQIPRNDKKPNHTGRRVKALFDSAIKHIFRRRGKNAVGLNSGSNLAHRPESDINKNSATRGAGMKATMSSCGTKNRPLSRVAYRSNPRLDTEILNKKTKDAFSKGKSGNK